MITIKYSLPLRAPYALKGVAYDKFKASLKALLDSEGYPVNPLFRVAKLKLKIQHNKLQMNNPRDGDKLRIVAKMLEELDVIRSVGVRCLRSQSIESSCPESEKYKARTDIYISFDEEHHKHQPITLSNLPICWDTVR